MIRKGLLFFAALCLSLAAGGASADVAPDPLNQGMTPARKESRVQMVSQEVVIHLGGDWCLVEANFLLFNRSRNPALMEVGFPTGYKDEVKELKVWRNGKGLQIKPSVEQEIMEPDKDPVTYHWVLWNMRFAPGEKTSLRVRYRIKPRINHADHITPYRQFVDGIAEEAQGPNPMPAEVRRVIDGIVSYSTGYIMVTGASWYDTIEKATVTLRHPKGAGALRWMEPEADFTVLPEGIRWQFSHIKPDFDVAVEFHDRWTLEEEIAAVEKALAVSDKRQGLKDHRRYLERLKQCLAAGNCGK
jgi:hypothetical protein